MHLIKRCMIYFHFFSSGISLVVLDKREKILNIRILSLQSSNFIGTPLPAQMYFLKLYLDLIEGKTW